MTTLLRLFLLCTGLILANPAPAQYDGAGSLPEAVNRAARQRMLSQRMAKAWLMQATDTESAKGSAELLETTALFDQNLKALAEPARLLDLAPAYDQVDARWRAYRQSLGEAKTRPLAARLLKESNELLRACDQFVSQLAQRAGHPGAKRIALSGLQRMLSQRLAKAYLARYWQVPYPGLQRELDNAQLEFDNILAVLLEAPDNTEALRANLLKLHEEWTRAKAALRGSPEGVSAPREVLAQSERLLALAEALTQDYQKLSQQAR